MLSYWELTVNSTKSQVAWKRSCLHWKIAQIILAWGCAFKGLWLLIAVRGSSLLWVAPIPEQVVLVYEKRIAKIDSGAKPTSTVVSYIVSASNPV